jgi:hypothetical protein
VRLAGEERHRRGRRGERQALQGEQVDQRQHAPLRQQAERQQQQEGREQVDQLGDQVGHLSGAWLPEAAELPAGGEPGHEPAPAWRRMPAEPAGHASPAVEQRAQASVGA